MDSTALVRLSKARRSLAFGRFGCAILQAAEAGYLWPPYLILAVTFRRFGHPHLFSHRSHYRTLAAVCGVIVG